jgi:hypothetical protein
MTAFARRNSSSDLVMPRSSPQAGADGKEGLLDPVRPCIYRICT